MTRDEIAIERERCVTQIDGASRDRGHHPAPWIEEGQVANTYCTQCGHTAAVRVQTGGTWQAGQLRWSDCPAEAAPE